MPVKETSTNGTQRTTLTLPDHKQFGTLVHFTVVGTSPLLQSCYSSDAEQRQLCNQLGLPMANKEKTDTLESVAAVAAYWYDVETKKLGIKGESFKRAMEDASKRWKNKKVPSTIVRGSVFIVETKSTDQGNLLPLSYASYKARTDSAVNEHTGSRIQAVRMEVSEWSCVVPIEFDSTFISLDHVAYLLALAGRMVGVGAWRPACGGEFGRFIIKSAE